VRVRMRSEGEGEGKCGSDEVERVYFVSKPSSACSCASFVYPNIKSKLKFLKQIIAFLKIRNLNQVKVFVLKKT